MGGVTPITAILHSKNEEAFIGRCVRSVQWADQVLLLDSGSTDDTVKIAKSLGVDVVETDWPGWALQRQRAEQLARNDWVLALDCDEIVSPELKDSILHVLSGEMDPADGYSVNRRGDFLGALLPNSSNRKNRQAFVRLYNRTRSGCDVEAPVHEQVLAPGRHIELAGDLIHWRGYTMDEYFVAFNRYATLEAEDLHRAKASVAPIQMLLRPAMRFAWLYLIKGEWRLGARGLMHAGLKACAEFMRYSKLWELEHVPEAVLHPPDANNSGAAARNTDDRREPASRTPNEQPTD